MSMSSSSRYIDLVLSKDFTTSTLPSIVCNLSAIAWMYDSYAVLDTNKALRRNHVQSFFLTMIWMLGGGSLASIITMHLPAWTVDDSILTSMGIAWLAMRSPLLRRLAQTIYIPCLLVSHFFRAHLIITLLHATVATVGPRTILGPVLVTVIGSRGGGWVAQLILNCMGDPTRTTSDWSTKIPAGLKNVFFTVLIYFFTMDLGGFLGAPLVSYAVANSAMIALMTLDGVLNEYLGYDINFYLPLDYLIAALYSAFSWAPAKLSEKKNC